MNCGFYGVYNLYNVIGQRMQRIEQLTDRKLNISVKSKLNLTKN